MLHPLVIADGAVIPDPSREPTSPRILLSPSSPEFLAVDLREEDFSQVGTETGTKRIDKKLRHSLLLLDGSLAQLERTANSTRKSPPLTSLYEFGDGRVNTVGAEDDDGPIDFMLARGSFAGPGSNSRDLSTRSLASIASGGSSHRSSEDAFDIVDFPSIDQNNLGLAISTQLPPSPDLMTFPVPPSDHSLLPNEGGSLANSVDNSLEDDQLFEQLATLGKGPSVQGLGLFSASAVSLSCSRLAHSDTEIDSVSACSNLSSSLETSTLASSCAPTPGFGRSTSSYFPSSGKDDALPPSSLFVRRTANATHPIPSPPSIFTTHPEAKIGGPATLGSPFSLSLSPRALVESPRSSPTLASDSARDELFRPPSFLPPSSPYSPRQSSPASPATLSRSSSRSDLAFSELHQASLGLLGSFDDGGIPVWNARPEDSYARNGVLGDDENVEVLEDLAPPDRTRFDSLAARSPPSLGRTASESPVSPGQASPLGTLRRLSSFQILKKRKSENVLSTAATSSRPALAKPKSEAALSTLARRQAATELAAVDKENQPASAKLGKLSLRSRSSGRLSKLASPPATAESLGDQAVTSPRFSTFGRKRFSIFTSKQHPASVVPPVPPTPTEHLSPRALHDAKRLAISTNPSDRDETGDSGSSRHVAGLESPDLTPSSASFPATPTSFRVESDLTIPLSIAPTSSLSEIDDPITLATFLEASTPGSLTPIQKSEPGKSQASPLIDRTNWSRPTSPALLDALKTASPIDLDDLVVVPQSITVFPVRLPGPPRSVLAAKAEEEEEDGAEEEDDYGGGTDSDSDEDKPLGVTVPGALTAQKSLRKTMSKKKKKKQQPKSDPFEFEQAATLLRGPAETSDHKSSFAGSNAQLPASAVPDSSSRKNVHTQGHDSFLPQTDASIERKASSNGLRRSPSTPLDPMIANSSLTFESPVSVSEPLPVHRSDSRSAPSAAPPRTRPPPVPTAPSRRPSQVGDSPLVSALPLQRRPSLHPDVSQLQTSSPSSATAMQRQFSSTSNKSSASSQPSTPLEGKVPGPVNRPGVGPRSRSGTLPSAPVEHRVYLHRPDGKHLTVKVTERTVAGEVVAYVKARGALEGGHDSEGGWALWEIWTPMGLERPIREYELLNDIISSFDGDSARFVIRRSTLWPILSSHARVHPVAPKFAQVQLETKKGKWSKRFLELKDGTLSHSKSEKAKDLTVLCQLSNYSAYYVNEATSLRVKAPKPFVFALKSRLTRAHFEEVAQYLNFVSVKSDEELQTWMTTITEAGNQHFRTREQAVRAASHMPLLPSPPLLVSNPTSQSVAPLNSAQPPPSASSGPSQSGFLSRTKSSRPAPAVLAPSSSTENRPPVVRRGTSSKPLVELR